MLGALYNEWMEVLSDLVKSEAWHARRANNVGSSEIACLFNAQADYQLSRFALWHTKAGTVPRPDIQGERLMWGTLMEEAIAMGVTETKGWPTRKGAFYTDPTTPGMSCTLDFEIDHAEGYEGPGVLETKNIDMIQHKRSWTDGEPPLHILLQLQHQLACTGFKWGAVAGLVGGNRLEVYPYLARPKLITDIRRRVTEFWQSIADNKPPLVDGSDSASEVLSNLYPVIVDDAIDLRESNEWPEAVHQFMDATQRRKIGNEYYDEAKNRVVSLMQGHKRAWGAGYAVNCAITPAKESRPPKPGELIPGRAETRRYTAKVMEPKQ